MKTIAALPRVIGVSLLFGAAAYACTYLVKPTYESQEVLYFPQASGGSSPMDLLKGGAASDAGNVNLVGGMIVSPLVGGAPDAASGIITSKAAMRNTVDTLNLDQAWKTSKADAYDRVDGWTDAKVDKNGMLDVTAKAESPDQAVQILHSLRAYLEKRSQEMTLNVSRQNREYLEKRVASAAHEVNQIQLQLVDTMRNSPLADVGDVMKGYFAARDDLQKAQVAEATEAARLDSLQSQMKQLLARKDSFPNSVTALSSLDSDAKSLTDEIQARQLALDDAIANFTPNSPEVRSALRAVKTANAVSKQIVSAGQQDIKDGLTPDMIQAKSQLVALKTSTERYASILDAYQKSTIQAPREYAAVERMKMEFETSMKAYGALRGQLEMARLAENRDPSRFTVMDEAYPNPKPVGPHRGMITAVVFLLAGLFQLALISLKEEPIPQSDPAEWRERAKHVAVEMLEPTHPAPTKKKEKPRQNV